MRIGIDMDGVLIDIENYLMTHGSKFFWEKYKKKIANPFVYDIYKMFDVSQEAEEAFWDKHYYKYIMGAPRMFASEIISKLKDSGHKIFIITARTANGAKHGVADEEMQKLVAVWLEKNGIPYDKVIFIEGDKKDACIANKIDVMIEDSPSQIASVSQALPVLCFDARYNQNVDCQNVTRVYSWHDVLCVIEEIKKANKKK